MNDFHGVLLVLGFTGEGKLVLWLSIWNLVDSKPFIGSSDQSWQMSFNIFDVIEFGSQWVIDIDGNDLPVGFTFIEESHDTQDLDLLDLTRVADLFTDFTDVQWVVVTLGLGVWVSVVGVFPGL